MVFEARCFHLKPATYHLKPATDHLRPCDFNIHVDKENDPSAIKFMDILDNFDLIQHVKSSTHKSGHCLDLVITKRDKSLTGTPIIGPLFSEHFSVLCHVDVH